MIPGLGSGDGLMPTTTGERKMKFKEGDVFDYTPDVDWTGRPTHHCREAVAIVMDNGRGGLSILDTFWGTLSDAHMLTETELATAEDRFNVHDYDELERRIGEHKWREFAEQDRRLIPSQHGLQRRYLVRKGAQPDMATKIANAEQKVFEAESNLRQAESLLGYARERLAGLVDSESIES